MKRLRLVGLALSLAVALNAGQNGNGNGNGNMQQNNTNSTQNMAMDLNLSSYPLYTLTNEQIDEMKFMYEEEQVARDVYNYLYAKWGTQVFANIAKSEQKHMDAIGALLDRYSVAKPIINEQAGVFNNQTLQTAYNDLTQKGSISLEDALNVGVEIETMDIKDLEEAIVTANDDAKMVYEKLKNASYNHLNSLNSTLKSTISATTMPQTPNINEINSTCQTYSKHVNAGWSILGLPISEDSDIAQYFPIEANGAKVYGYSNGSWRVSELQAENGKMAQRSVGIDMFNNLTPFEGFWIYSKNSFTLNSCIK